jgi:uncharacterized protein (DUF4415 family)
VNDKNHNSANDFTDDGNVSYVFKPTQVTLAAIDGVTAPEYGETPVTAITETAQYTGSVRWSPTVSGTYAANTAYTATITLIPKTGYTLTGVGVNFFTVAGAAATNDANSGTVTAVFPQTGTAPPNALTGTETINNMNPKIGDALTGSLDGGNNTGTLSYQWKANGANAGTGSSYTVLLSDLSKTITLEITSSVETGSVTSATTAAVLKKTAPSAPSAPILTSKTHNSVTLTANALYEFSKDGTAWQMSNIFGGLNPSTSYTFYQRIAETDDTEASAKSPALNETTNAAPPNALTGTATISSMNPRIGDVLTGSLGGGNNTGTLTYTWKTGGTVVGGNSATYTVQIADLGKTIMLEIISSAETGTVTSTATAAVLKTAAPSAPSAPILTSKTHNSVTLMANALYEFSKDGTAWQTSNIFGGLNPNTAYTFYQRIAETGDTEVSATSPALNETTNAAPPNALTGTATISNTNPRIGDALTGSLDGGNNTGTLTYTWKADGTVVSGNSATYIVQTIDLGKTITLEITSSLDTG